MEPSVWFAFFFASWAISISPGAGAVAAMSAGLSHGFVRGYFMTFGLVLGIWTQVLVVGLGLGAVIATSELGFAIIKWMGAGYLLWLGIRQWVAASEPLVAETAEVAKISRGSLVMRGWMINAVNPKGTIFLLAVVPPFLDVTRPLSIQYGVIAATLGFTDLVVMAGYTALAARVLRLLKSPRLTKVINRCFGALFVAVAILLATFQRN